MLRHRLLPFAAILVLAAILPVRPTAAQEAPPRWTPFVGVAVGPTTLPEEFQGCDPHTTAALDGRAGVLRGRWGAELRVAALNQISGATCVSESALPPADGIEVENDFPFDGSDGLVAADVRLRYGGVAGTPWVLAVGGGWLAWVDRPYALVSAGLRSGGRVRVAVDVDHARYPVEYDRITVRWSGGLATEVDREERSALWGSTSVRVGVEVPLR